MNDANNKKTDLYVTINTEHNRYKLGQTAVIFSRAPAINIEKKHDADQTCYARIHLCKASVTVVLQVSDLKSQLLAPRLSQFVPFLAKFKQFAIAVFSSMYRL